MLEDHASRIGTYIFTALHQTWSCLMIDTRYTTILAIQCFHQHNPLSITKGYEGHGGH